MTVKKTTTTPKASTALAPKVRRVTRDTDANLSWVEREYPQLETWRVLAVEWMKGETRGIDQRLQALVTFFERYLVQQGLPLDPAVFLARSTVLPDFYRTACPDSAKGIKYNNSIQAFLHFVLLRLFSEAADDGQPVVSPAFRNPVPRMSKSGLPKRDESVHSPLPYGYIDELRQMLAAGPHFCDWQWAQSELGFKSGYRQGEAQDWFEVAEDLLDRNDPDCVWRERLMKNGTRLEMWSPVRWVALLIKLILPLRTFQVRMLDSGEADTWRYSAGEWTLNPRRLAQGSERRPLQQGVFRRSNPLNDGEEASTVLYINTNKTADIAKSVSEKGYLLPWLVRIVRYIRTSFIGWRSCATGRRSTTLSRGAQLGQNWMVATSKRRARCNSLAIRMLASSSGCGSSARTSGISQYRMDLWNCAGSDCCGHWNCDSLTGVKPIATARRFASSRRQMRGTTG